jgi:hypothetical protein
MGLSNNGRDLVARGVGGDTVGFSGATTSAPTATTATDTGAAFPASSGTPAIGGLVGHVVVMGNNVYGVVLSNSGTVLTVDHWHSPTNPETVATTPGSGGYIVLPGGFPAFWMGISVATRAFNAADQVLSNDGTAISELWFSGGGLRRQMAAWAHTNGTATYTVAKTYTANGSDTLPQTIAKVGLFQHGVTAAPTTTTSGMMLFNTNLASTATLSAVGDNVAITDTVTAS